MNQGKHRKGNTRAFEIGPPYVLEISFKHLKEFKNFHRNYDVLHIRFPGYIGITGFL
jgi:hypothetical protein